MFERYAGRGRRALVYAQQEARRLEHCYIGTEHLLLGILREEGSGPDGIFGAFDITLDTVRRQVEDTIGPTTTATIGSQMAFTLRAQHALEYALQEALQLGHHNIGTEHLAIALLENPASASVRVLTALGVDLARVRKETMMSLARTPTADVRFEPTGTAILHFGRVLTAATSRPAGATVGRGAEIERIRQVLSRRWHRNALLVGRPGVGKTAVVTGLAELVARGNAGSLSRHYIVAIGSERFLSDVHDRTETEERVRGLLRALEGAESAILFFDDLPYLTRVTSFDVEVGNVLAPLIDAGYSIIGASTPELFEQSLRGDPLIGREFEPIEIAEPSIEDSVGVLELVRADLELHHRITITDAALMAAVRLARRYRPGRVLPGSAIDVLDDAAALLSVRRSTPEVITDLNQRILVMRAELERAVVGRDYDLAARLRDDEAALLLERGQHGVAARMADKTGPDVLDEEQVAASLGVDLRSSAMSQGAVHHARLAGVQLPIRDRSTAILIGSGIFTDARLPDLPAISSNLLDLRRSFTSQQGLFEPARVHVFDHVQHGDLRSIGTLARDTPDTLVVYYAGHGLNENDDLYLALYDTDPDEPQVTGLPYRMLRHMVTSSPARRCIVILDCCYGGKVIGWMSSGAGNPVGELDIKGTYVLTATGTSEKAIAPPGDRNTAFTGALLDLLSKGAANGREFICVADLHPHLSQELRARNLPLPRQRPVDTIGGLAIARNAAWHPAGSSGLLHRK